MSSSQGRFRSFAWVSVKETEVTGLGRFHWPGTCCSCSPDRFGSDMFFQSFTCGRPNNETSCQLVSFVHHLRMRNDLPMFHQFAADLHSLAENSCRWENAQPPCSLVQCVGNFVADDRHGTPSRHLVWQNRLADPVLDSTLLPRRISCCGLHLSPKISEAPRPRSPSHTNTSGGPAHRVQCLYICLATA